MGCSSTNSLLKEDTPKLTTEKLQYINRNERLESLASDILDDCLKTSNGTESGIAEIARVILQTKDNNKNGLTQDELTQSIKDVYVQQFLCSSHFVTEVDLLAGFEEKFLTNTFTSYDIDTNDFNVVLQSVFIQIQQYQNAIKINFDPVTYLEDPNLLNAFYNNLKFNKTFQCEMIHYQLYRNVLNNISTCEALSEIISCNKYLSTLIIEIGNDITTPEQINNLLPFMQVAIKHKHVQTVVIVNPTKTKIVLGNTIENEVIKLLQQNANLFAFALINFGLSDAFMKSLAKCIPLCAKLKCFVIDSWYSDVNILDDLVKGISSSNSLLMVVFGGFKISQDKVEQYKQVKVSSGGMNRHAVKVFECVERVNLY